jgi:crossover junction endodeoxyribonuclease RusA
VGQSLSFTVPGKPQPKERPRRAKSGTWYTPSKTKKYERLVAMCAMADGVRFSGPVKVRIAIYWPDRRKRDLDNAAKSICDGMNGVVYADDSQITEMHITADTDRDAPRAEVTVSTRD